MEHCETPPNGGVFVFGRRQPWSRMAIHAAAAGRTVRAC